jgi:hypothetical protein
MPLVFRVALASSAAIAGAEALQEKYAKKPGCCQCTRFGTTTRSRSASIASQPGSPSPCSGGVSGSAASVAPTVPGPRTGRSASEPR